MQYPRLNVIVHAPNPYLNFRRDTKASVVGPVLKLEIFQLITFKAESPFVPDSFSIVSGGVSEDSIAFIYRGHLTDRGSTHRTTFCRKRIWTRTALFFEMLLSLFMECVCVRVSVLIRSSKHLLFNNVGSFQSNFDFVWGWGFLSGWIWGGIKFGNILFDQACNRQGRRRRRGGLNRITISAVNVGDLAKSTNWTVQSMSVSPSHTRWFLRCLPCTGCPEVFLQLIGILIHQIA